MPTLPRSNEKHRPNPVVRSLNIAMMLLILAGMYCTSIGFLGGMSYGENAGQLMRAAFWFVTGVFSGMFISGSVMVVREHTAGITNAAKHASDRRMRLPWNRLEWSVIVIMPMAALWIWSVAAPDPHGGLTERAVLAALAITGAAASSFGLNWVLNQAITKYPDPGAARE